MRRIAIGMVAAAMAVGGLAAPAGAAEDDGDGAGEWPASIRPIAREVERIRGLDFDEPVPVRFLSDRRFEKELTVDQADLTKRERREIRRAEAQMRALGLIDADVDLFEAFNTSTATDTLAFYDYEDESITVRGSKDDLDAVTKATIAHELTHALQDQTFDLERLYSGARTTGDDFARLALVEGDASYVEEQYVATLPRSEQDDYYAQFEGEIVDESAADAPRTDSVPPIVGVIQSAPYDFGPQMVAVLDAEDGLDAIDAAFRKPPRTEEQVMEPAALLDRDKARCVAVPDLPDGADDLARDGEPTDFGALSLYFVLSGRIDPTVALAAADAWAGDAVRTYETESGPVCTAIAVAGEGAEGTAAIQDAMQRWAAAMPAGAASVAAAAASGPVTLTACESPATTGATEESMMLALGTLYGRNDLFLGDLAYGNPADVAMCVANTLIRSPEFRAFYNTPEEPTFEELERLDAPDGQAQQTCGA